MNTNLHIFQPDFSKVSRGPSDLDHRIGKVWRGPLGFHFYVEIGEEYFEDADASVLERLLTEHDAETTYVPFQAVLS